MTNGVGRSNVKLLDGGLIRLMFGHGAQALGYSSMPMLPVLLVYYGASREEVGWVMAAGSAGGLLFRPIVGWALDAWGKVRTLMVGTTILACAMMSMGLIEDVNWVAYGARFLFGIGAGVCFTGYFALATDLIPKERRTEGTAIFGVSGLLPLALNPIWDYVSESPEQISFVFPVLGLCVLGSLLTFAKGFDFRGTSLPKEQSESSASTVRLRDLFTLDTLSIWWMTPFFGGTVSAFLVHALVSAETRGLDGAVWMWVAYAASAIAVRLGGGALPDRFGNHNFIVPASAAYVGAAWCMAGAESWVMATVAGGLAGIGHGYCFPILVSSLMTRVPEAMRGRAMAGFTGLWDIASLVAAPAVGKGIDVYGDSLAFWAMGAVALFGVSGWALLEYFSLRSFRRRYASSERR